MSHAIQFAHVSKRYRIGRWLPSLRDVFRSRSGVPDDGFHWAVKDVSFELGPGEALGIIGPNGAGKTTILKLLSRITPATQGEIHVNGRFSALIELGAGFHPDLTGRENIYLNGAILGMGREAIRARFGEIVDFAGIGKYLDTPVKRYSSGMYARLGFSIAAHVDPDVLLVDEVLAVGDYAFQQKCYARMDALRANGTALIFVSHNLDAVRRVCDKGLVMYRGESIFLGSAAESVLAYSEAVRQAARNAPQAAPEEQGLAGRSMTFEAEIEEVRLLNSAGELISVAESGAAVVVAIDVLCHGDIRGPIFALTVRTPDGRLVYDTTTRWMNIETGSYSAGERCTVEFHLDLPLLEGQYTLGVDIAEADYRYYYDRLEQAQDFVVRASDQAKGLVNLNARVRFASRNGHRPGQPDHTRAG
jgi:ABC-type polysaccharide/polyol phosphate transport system ATPase subunit